MSQQPLLRPIDKLELEHLIPTMRIVGERFAQLLQSTDGMGPMGTWKHNDARTVTRRAVILVLSFAHTQLRGQHDEAADELTRIINLLDP